MSQTDEDGQADGEEPAAGSTDGSGAEPGDPVGRDGSIDGSEREGEPSEPDDEQTDGEEPLFAGKDYGKRFIFPGLTLLFLVVILISFHKILLPFIFACALVYLMEPIVVRLSRSPADGSGLPRWITVILVYLVFLGIVTVSSILIIPQLVGEVVRLGETAPQTIQQFRNERLPAYNNRIQSYLSAFVPSEAANASGVDQARRQVRSARRQATARTLAFDHAGEAVHRAADLELRWTYQKDGVRDRVYRPARQVRKPDEMTRVETVHGRWQSRRVDGEPAFRVVPTGNRGLEVYMNSGAIEVSEVGEGTWSIRRSSANGTRGPPVGGSPGEAGFDLEERLNHVIESAVTFSNEQLASLIEFAQHLVVGILEAIIAILMTLMVAAFISIDLPRFMGFFRGLVPEAWHTDFDDLLGEVDRGLSGVIRGQLIICVINGIFTYIGLVLIDVKFSVLLAVIAGLFSIIPVFGAVISTIPICLVALTQGLMPALLILGWILGIHFIEGNILNPKIIGTSAEIHPVIVIFALLAGESTYGLVGAILAVPVASIILSLYKFSRDKLWEDEERSAVPEEKTLNQN